MEIKPAYVTFEQAKRFEEKGIKFNCDNNWEEGKRSTTPDIWKLNGYGEAATNYYPAPEQWQVVEELRVNYGIHIRVDAWLQEDGSNQGYDFCVYRTWKDKIDYELKILNSSIQIKLYDSPQEAYSAAFDYVLNNLI